MRIYLVFCAVSLACTSCVADAEKPKPARSGTTPEIVAKHIAATEHDSLQAWCTEDGRSGLDVALRVVDMREPAEEPTDVLCDEIAATEPADTTEAVGEAPQGLTPFGWGCAAASVTLAYKSGDFCEAHPEVPNCARKFTLGSIGLGAMCFFFF